MNNQIDWNGCPHFGRTHKMKRFLEIVYKAMLDTRISSYSMGNFNIIEIGTTGSHTPTSGGAAGFVLSWFCLKYAGRFITVDNDVDQILISKKELAICEGVVLDGVVYLKELPPEFKINMIYLDGPAGPSFAKDCYDVMKKNLDEFSIIMLDDIYERVEQTRNDSYGKQAKVLSEKPRDKGALVVPAMLKDGWVEDGKNDGVPFIRVVDFDKPSLPTTEIFYTKKFKEFIIDG